MSRTVKVKSSHPASQGDFVEIEAADFDPSKHELLDGETLIGDSAPPPANESDVDRFVRFASSADAVWAALRPEDRQAAMAAMKDAMDAAADAADAAPAKSGKKTAKAVKEADPAQSGDINAGAPGWGNPAA